MARPAAKVKAANLVASIAIALWLSLAVLGYRELRHVEKLYVPGYPTMAQASRWLVWPLLMASGLLLCAWLCNIGRRSPRTLSLLSFGSMLLLFSYLALLGNLGQPN